MRHIVKQLLALISELPEDLDTLELMAIDGCARSLRRRTRGLPRREPETSAADGASPALTLRQSEVAVWIRDFIAVHRYPPTLREIGYGLGIHSTNGVTEHLRALEGKGVLRIVERQARGIVMLFPDRTVDTADGLITQPADVSMHAPKPAGAGLADNSVSTPAPARGGAVA